jgi:hypothetical protein
LKLMPDLWLTLNLLVARGDGGLCVDDDKELMM